MPRMMLIAVLLPFVAVTLGCERQPAPPSAPPTEAPKPAAPQSPTAGHTGEVVELGTVTIGEWTVRAARDKSEIKAGGDAPIDVWLTTSDGKPATVAVVRFWIGLEDAKVSRKARADIEDPRQPNHWHTHADVPDPIPENARLWVEIERDQNETTVGSFDLKR